MKQRGHIFFFFFLILVCFYLLFSPRIPCGCSVFIYLFIYLWLCWVFVSVRGLSLVAASGGHSSSRCAGLSPSRKRPYFLMVLFYSKSLQFWIYGLFYVATLIGSFLIERSCLAVAANYVQNLTCFSLYYRPPKFHKNLTNLLYLYNPS